jgi:hypothetical protein
MRFLFYLRGFASLKIWKNNFFYNSVSVENVVSKMCP